MTIDNLGYAQKADVPLQGERKDFKPALADLASSESNADYQRARATTIDKTNSTVASQFGGLKIENRATDITAHYVGSAEEFRKRGQDVFSKVDRDHDGVLDGAELSRASVSKDFSSNDRQVIEAMWRNSGGISLLSDDEVGGDESGVSMRDLDQFAGLDARAKRYKEDAPIETWFGHSNNFVHVDADGDGYLTRDEIGARLNDKKISRQEASALQRMRTSYDALMAESNDEWGRENSGITRRDIDTLVRERQVTAREADTMNRVLTTMHQVHSRQSVHDNKVG
jgi:hypothetical protein